MRSVESFEKFAENHPGEPVRDIQCMHALSVNSDPFSHKDVRERTPRRGSAGFEAPGTRRPGRRSCSSR